MTRGSGVVRFLRRAGLAVAAGVGVGVGVGVGAGFACLGAVAPRTILGAVMAGALAGLATFAVVVGRADSSADQHRRRPTGP